MKREGVSPDYPEVYCWLGLLRTHTTRTPLPDAVAVAAQPTLEQIADVKQRIGDGSLRQAIAVAANRMLRCMSLDALTVATTESRHSVQQAMWKLAASENTSRKAGQRVPPLPCQTQRCRERREVHRRDGSCGIGAG